MDSKTDRWYRVLGVICLACASPPLLDGTHWFLFVAATSFTATIMWAFIYLFNIRESFKLPINWTLMELMNTAVITVLYFTAFIVQLVVWSQFAYFLWTNWNSCNIAAGVFGLFNFLAYAAGVYFLLVEWKNIKAGN